MLPGDIDHPERQCHPDDAGNCVWDPLARLLFTRGSVPIYRTYPGLREPRPIMIRPYSLDTPMSDVAMDILALTKMNWNTTQFDGALPIPIRAARQVGKVLRHVPIGQKRRPNILTTFRTHHRKGPLTSTCRSHQQAQTQFSARRLTSFCTRAATRCLIC